MKKKIVVFISTSTAHIPHVGNNWYIKEMCILQDVLKARSIHRSI